jgi:hypothetical protein
MACPESSNDLNEQLTTKQGFETLVLIDQIRSPCPLPVDTNVRQIVKVKKGGSDRRQNEADLMASKDSDAEKSDSSKCVTGRARDDDKCEIRPACTANHNLKSWQKRQTTKMGQKFKSEAKKA